MKTETRLGLPSLPNRLRPTKGREIYEGRSLEVRDIPGMVREQRRDKGFVKST